MQTSDLDNALDFVIARIHEQAERSCAPLGGDEIDFLHHLPTRPTIPTAWGFHTAGQDSWPALPLRDPGFERLCSLARDAHRYDVGTRPTGSEEWKFAGSVLQLNEHPMAWLLNWAGMRTQARWGGCLLVFCALLVVILFSAGALAICLLLRPDSGLPFITICIVCGAALAGALAVSYLSMRKIERWLRCRAVRRYRCALPVETSRITS